MNPKNKPQIEVKFHQCKERSYYEWGSNMQIVRKGNGEIAMTEGELARFFGVTWRKLNNTRVRDKKRLEKVGNLVKNSYLYR